MMPEMKTLNGYEVVDAKAREDIETLKNAGLDVDLSEYAKKTDIPDVSDFISEIPSEYVTETELNSKGYLTQHQDISNKADNNHTHTEYLTEHQSLANYATKKYVDDAIADIDIPEDTDLSEYAKKSEIPTVPTKTSQLTNDSNFLTNIPAEYVTETELNNKGYLTQHQSLTNYATKSYVDTAIANVDISAVPTKTSQLTNDSNFATRSEVGAAIAELDIPDTTSFATKSYVDAAIDDIELEASTGNPTYRFSWNSLTTEFSEFLGRVKSGFLNLDKMNLILQDSTNNLAANELQAATFANVHITQMHVSRNSGSVIEFHALTKINSGSTPGDFALVTYRYEQRVLDGPWTATSSVKNIDALERRLQNLEADVAFIRTQVGG